MNSLLFNLHGILRIRVEAKSTSRFHHLDFPLSYFESDDDGKTPDINLVMGKFEPDTTNAVSLDHSFVIKDNYLFRKVSTRNAKWNYEIRGLDYGQINIRFHGAIRGFEQAIIPNYLAFNTVLKPIVDVALLRRGFCAIHGLGFQTGSIATLCAGRGGSHKTLIAMDIIRNHKETKLLGDDWVILAEDRTLLSFPILFPLLPMKVAIGKESISGVLSGLQLFRNRACLSKESREGGEYFVDRATLSRMFFLARSVEGREFEARRITPEQAAAGICRSNRVEMIEGGISRALKAVDFLHSVYAYSHVYPDSKLANHWRVLWSTLRKYLEKQDISFIRMPRDYDDALFRRIGELEIAENR